jgi:ubiquinone/menaquinone biosynthesis C-methylase UbiE
MTTISEYQQAFGRTYGGTAAENYERFFVPVIPAPLARELVAEAELRPGDRVLDVACGTGIVARLAAERVGPSGSVAGLDVNAAMLSVARTLTPSSGPAIRWYETTAESIPLPDESFDVVFCQLGLQFVPDKLAALREMRRVLRTGGRARMSVPTPPPIFDVLDESLSRLVPQAAGFVRMVFSLNDPSELERLLRSAGFRDVAVARKTNTIRLPAPDEFLWQYVRSTPLAGLLANVGEDTLGELEREVVERWRPWVQEDASVSYEQGGLVASATVS